MKKKSLVKYLGLMGLTLVATSCEKEEGTKQVKEKQGHSSPQKGQSQKIGFTPIVELSLPDSVAKQIMALSSLIEDVFGDTLDIQSFLNDPQKYFTSMGIDNCNIDLNSVEMKAILAMRDQDVKNAIIARDLHKFIQLLESKNYISSGHIYFNGFLKKHLEHQLANNQDIKKLLKEWPEITEASPFVWATVIAIVVAAVYIVAAVEVYFWVDTVGLPDDKPTSAMPSPLNPGFNFDNPVLKIWGLETQSNDILVVNELIEQNVDRLVALIENMDVYKKSNMQMEHEDLKNLIRKPVTQYFIDAGLL